MMEVNRVENNEKRSTAELLAALLPGQGWWNKGSDLAPVGRERAEDRPGWLIYPVPALCVTSVIDNLGTEAALLLYNRSRRPRNNREAGPWSDWWGGSSVTPFYK